MNDGEAIRLVVASRRAPRIVREARSPEDAIAIVREAIENDRTLGVMGKNHVGEEEARELAGRVMEAVTPAARRVLVRRELARTRARRTHGVDRGEAFMDEMERRLRGRGER